MANRKNTFLIKRSNVAGNIPSAGQILLGELALNTADVKLYASGTTAGSILPIGWDRIARTGDTMSGNLTVPTVIGNLTGTASLATNTTNIGITNNTSTNATYYPTFVSAISGNLPLQVDNSTLTYNPSTNTLTVPNLVGNSSSATVLQTTRAINGTNFNGSAAITTAQWGTARNITIGNTTKSVNGSANVAWSLAEIGATGTIGGSGTVNYLPKFSTTTTLTNSLIFDNGSNVGIGGTTPTATLDVFGRVSQQMAGGNTVFGFSSLTGETGISNVAIGSEVMTNYGYSMFNVAIGKLVMAGTGGTGTKNVGIGYKTLFENTTGSYNAGFGSQTLEKNTTGSYNFAAGNFTMLYNTTGSHNVAIGRQAMWRSETGNDNIALGYDSFVNNTNGVDSIALGRLAGGMIGTTVGTYATDSIFIGKNARGLDKVQTNQIVIGADASGVGTNSVVLGNDSITKTILKGNVGIGLTNPSYKLTVDGDISTDSYSKGQRIGFNVADGYEGGAYPHYGLGKKNGVNPLNMCGYFGISFATEGIERIRLDNLGNFGIGTTAPTYPMHIIKQVNNVSIYASNDIVAYSDISVKENIRPIENVLQKISLSRGVMYDRNDCDSKDNIGFIAQELEEQFPELVVENPDGTKAVKYQNATAVLFEAVKEQQKQINSLEDKITEILKRLDNGITN